MHYLSFGRSLKSPTEVTDKMYEKILNDPLRFGEEFNSEACSILTGLLNRDPSRRLGVKGADEIKRHQFFHKHIDFRLLAAKKIHPPFKPSVASPVVRFLFLNHVSCLTHYPRMSPTSTWSSPKKHQLTALLRIRIFLRLFKPSSMVCSQHIQGEHGPTLKLIRFLVQWHTPHVYALITVCISFHLPHICDLGFVHTSVSCCISVAPLPPIFSCSAGIY